MSDKPNVVEVSEATFQTEVIERSKQTPVLVDFWAPWCVPCRTLSPTLERVAADGDGAFVLAKINTDANQRLAMQYNVRSIPSVKMFRGGRVVDEFVGVKGERDVREFVKAFAPSQVDRWMLEAESRVVGERWDEAIAAYRRILKARPGHPHATLELGRLLIAAGQGDAAEAVLREVPAGAPEYNTAEALRPLAQLIADAQSPNEASDGLDAKYRAAGQCLLDRRPHHAVDALLDLLRQNRNYRDGEAKGAVLALLTYLGDDPSVKDYRRQLASVLF